MSEYNKNIKDFANWFKTDVGLSNLEYIISESANLEEAYIKFKDYFNNLSNNIQVVAVIREYIHMYGEKILKDVFKELLKKVRIREKIPIKKIITVLKKEKEKGKITKLKGYGTIKNKKLKVHSIRIVKIYSKSFLRARDKKGRFLKASKRLKKLGVK